MKIQRIIKLLSVAAISSFLVVTGVEAQGTGEGGGPKGDKAPTSSPPNLQPLANLRPRRVVLLQHRRNLQRLQSSKLGLNACGRGRLR